MSQKRRRAVTPLRAYLDAHAIKQGAFAKRLGVHRTYICVIAKGKRNPSLRLAQKIASETGLTLDELFPARRVA